jgi:hypothetical protein
LFEIIEFGIEWYISLCKWYNQSENWNKFIFYKGEVLTSHSRWSKRQ